MTFQHTPSIDHTKYTARLLMLMVAISYPVFGVIIKLFHVELNAFITHRLIVSAIIFGFYILTYKSEFVVKNLTIIIMILYYLLTADIMYMCIDDNFHEVYKFGILVMTFASSIIMGSKLEIVLYSIFILMWLLLSYFFIEKILIGEVIFIVFLILAIILSYVILKIRMHLYGHLILSDQIVSNTDSLVLLFNNQGELMFANPTVEKIIGYKAKDMLSDGWWGLQQQNTTQQHTTKERIKEIINGAEISNYDLRNTIHTKQFDTIWIDWQISKLGNQLILIGNDATSTVLYQKKHAELSVVAQSSKDMVIIADKDDRITWVNDAFTEITGYTFREALGQVPLELFRSPKVNPKTTEYITQKIKDKESFETEILNIGKNGEEFWLSIRTRILLDAKGEIEKYITLGNDITKSKEVAEKLKISASRSEIMHKLDKVILTSKSPKNIIDYALGTVLQLVSACDRVSYTSYDLFENSAFVVKDINREKTHFHKKRQIDLNDISGIEELINGNSFYIPELDKKPTMSPIDCILVKKQFKGYMMFPLLNDGKLVGSLNIASKSANPFSHSDQWAVEEVVHEFAMAIQQRTMENTIKKNNLELLNSNTQLKRLNDELSQFAHVVSHDLKAPLRAIMTLADFIALDHKDKLNGAGKDQLDLLKSRTKRMGDLIEGILQYSQVEIEKSTPSEIQIQEVVNIVLNTLVPGDHISITSPSDLPTIMANNIRIQQVFQNILSNAIKYCNQSKGVIELGFTDANDFWRFYVKDNGKGIDKKHHDRIFRIFQTLRPRDEMENTGIGLTITKKIIEMYGGEIWIESSHDSGTTFHFTLPKNKAA